MAVPEHYSQSDLRFLGKLVLYITTSTSWLIPLSKWVITPVINGISRVNPLIIRVITHLLSWMSHQCRYFRLECRQPPATPRDASRTGKEVAFHSPARKAWMQMTGTKMASASEDKVVPQFGIAKLAQLWPLNHL